MLLAFLLAFWPPNPPHVFPQNVLQYFPATEVCITSNPSNVRECSTTRVIISCKQVMIQTIKGNPVWGWDALFIRDGWLLVLDDHSDTGRTDVVRDLATGKIGYRWLPLFIPPPGGCDVIPPVYKEIRNGFCNGEITTFSPVSQPIEQSYRYEKWNGWLTLPSGETVDVRVLIRVDTWDSHATETYAYGYYVDSAGESHGLGLIRWQYEQDGKMLGNWNGNYVIPCPAIPSQCTICP